MTHAIDPHTKLQVRPLQLIETAEAVILRRGCTRIKVAGQGAAAGVQLLLASVSQDGATSQEICASFPPALHPSVQQLILQLLSVRMLVPIDSAEPPPEPGESSLDVFYWNFGATASQVARRLKDAHIVILGVNYVSRQLALSLSASGFGNCQIVDIPILRNLDLFAETGALSCDQWPTHLKPPITDDIWKDRDPTAGQDCLVACSDFMSAEQCRAWNRRCIERKWSFFPVVLDDLIGRIGPFVIPGETACYECLYARQNSNLENYEIQRAVDSTSLQGQGVIGLLPSMATVLGDLASFELTKLYSGVLPAQNIGKLIEVNLLATHLTSRKIFKVPRCLACSPLNDIPSSNPRRALLEQSFGAPST